MAPKAGMATVPYFQMTDENKALIGRDCFVEIDGIRQRGMIIDVVESMTSDKIILHCVQLYKRQLPQMQYDIGTKSVQLIGEQP